MFKKDSSNCSIRSGTFEVDVVRSIQSLDKRVTALEESEKTTNKITNDFVKKILDHIVIAINEVCLRLGASSNSKDIERYSRSILDLSVAYKNFK